MMAEDKTMTMGRENNISIVDKKRQTVYNRELVTYLENQDHQRCLIMMPFGLKIAIINRAFRKKLDEKAKNMGLTSVQLRVLGAISRLAVSGESDIHQKDLEQIEHITHPAMTRHIQQLEKKGFVHCVSDEKDRRYKKIICTEKSSGIHRIILAHDQEVCEELCGNLTEEQRQLLNQMTDMIVKNILSK